MTDIFTVSILFLLACSTSGEIEPGQCLSRFDYDYKVMTKLVDIEKRLQELEATPMQYQGTKSVAFMAQRSTSITDPEQGSVIVFDSVVTNIGDAYNAGTGIFVADVDGTYNFHLFASSPKKTLGHWLHLYMMKNSEQVGYVYLDDNNDRWAGRSASIVLHLRHGDRVYVKVGRRKGSGTLAGCCFHTHFNGFLIEQDEPQ